MERSTGFQDSKQANFPYQMSQNKQPEGELLSQPMSQYQAFQGEPFSQPIGPNQSFKGLLLSQPIGQDQTLHGEQLSQPLGPNQPFEDQATCQLTCQNKSFQCKNISQPMSQIQPFQGQPPCQPMAQNLSFQFGPLNQPMGQTHPYLGEPLSQPSAQNQPLQSEHVNQPMAQNQPFRGQHPSQIMGQKQPFQSQPFSKPICQNLSFQSEPLSHSVVQNKPFKGESLSQHKAQNHQFQGELPSRLRGSNQPCQGEPSPNLFNMQSSYKIDEPIQVLGNKSCGNCLNWTREMARLLIIAVSYIVEAESSESSELRDEASNKKFKHISKMTMWKVLSTVMSERGYNVSPQQCEEKFRDINNKYKQMIGLLGRATSCNVVENPILLDSINMPENKKEEVRKLLQSDQFHYREMCSFHHGNRMFLPHDWDLRSSIFLNLANYDNHVKNQQGNPNEACENQNESKVITARWAEVEEKSLEIQQQRLEFEKARFEWLCFNRNEDLKLEKMRLENERLKLENAKLAFELKRRQNFSVDNNH